MNEQQQANVLDKLKSLQDPETGRTLAATGQLLSTSFSSHGVELVIGLTSHSAPLREKFIEKVKSEVAKVDPSLVVAVTIKAFERPPQPLGTIGLTCKSVIAVGSGKGGVGKSTVATSLALALKRAGCRTGLLDADVYGPSVPQLLGLKGQPPIVDNKIQPIEFDGMPVMSIGLLVQPEEAVIWRGPMLHSAVTRFVRDVHWGPLDYLIIDMPPGTGDVALSLSQMVPLTGAVVVCTPQRVALLDAIKAVAMFQKVQIPVLGLVENMSTFICPDTGKQYDIFGSGGVKQFAEYASLPFLGELPINIGIRERGDTGDTIANFTDPQVATYLNRLAENLAEILAKRAAANPVRPQLPILK
ncbi:MAG TPA: Mrp/NBP35 family ATP-binding protein [Pirellulaceae bacterium]|nr:Mrp/NBP35 family ATP-binding protein [Pirellulaceae bacterium]